MIKIITTKPYGFSVSFSIFAHTTVYEYNRLILILTTRWPEPPSNQILAIHFNCISREKIKIFVRPKSCNLRPSSNHFVNLSQLHDYLVTPIAPILNHNPPRQFLCDKILLTKKKKKNSWAICLLNKLPNMYS